MERRLLVALAVAQSDEPELLDNYLYRLALEPALRAALAQAVTDLASCLSVLGHRIARPAAPACLPAAALTVARRQALELDGRQIDWPRPASIA